MKSFLILFAVFVALACAAEKKEAEEKKVFQRLIPADVLRGESGIFSLSSSMYLASKNLNFWREN